MDPAILDSIRPYLYTYTPLKAKTNIRLLQLHAPADKLQGHLYTELIEISLEDAKKRGFNALSYAWGKLVFNEQIYMDRRPWPVTATLLSALSNLAEEGPCLIWVDALCINQLDLVEKGTQIPFMTQIYRSAKQVQVWLGEETAAARVAFEWIPLIMEDIAAIVDDPFKSTIAKTAECSLHLKIYRRKAQCVSELFERDWFQRLWVFQEAMEARSIRYVCGSLRMAGRVLVNFVAALQSGSVAGQCMLSPTSLSAYTSFVDMQDTTRSDMIDLIMDTRERKCFDPRDRLYALVGLTRDPSVLPYPATYEKDQATVYADFAFHNLSQCRQLRVLEYCYLAPGRLDGLPSWAPDWTHLNPAPLSDPPMREWRSSYAAKGLESWKYQNPIHQPRSEPPSLFLNGVISDTVEFVWPLPYNIARSNEATRLNAHLGLTFEQLLLLCGRSSKHPIPWSILWRTIIFNKHFLDPTAACAVETDEALVEAALNEIIYDWQTREEERRRPNDSEQTQTSPEYGKPLLKFRSGWGVSFLPNGKTTEMLKMQMLKTQMKWKAFKYREWIPAKPPAANESARNIMKRHEIFVRVYKILDHYLAKRSFCITESGRCGWVPDVTRAGDMVTIFAGHEMPLILRLCNKDLYKVVEECDYKGGSYQVVGESYIHGIADSDAFIGKGAEVFSLIRLV